MFSMPRPNAEAAHASRFTDKFHRCIGHVQPSMHKYGYPKGTDYAICTTSIGYKGSYTPAAQSRAKKRRTQEKLGVSYDYSSTQVNLPPELAAKVAKLAAKIPDHHLAKDGRENDPHVTVKYGLHTQNPRDVSRLVSSAKPPRVTLGRTSIFPGGPDKDYDVVKIDVDSPELHSLNATLSDGLPHTDTYPVYKPHVTVAYVKKGLGTQYAGRRDLDGASVRASHLTFSPTKGPRVHIPLRGA